MDIVDNQTIIKNFVDLQERVAIFFKSREKGLGKKIYYVEKVGIPRPTFDRKLKNKSFTADELSRIVNAINESFTI